ncbi:MAG TPA: molybdopterin-dependent oxidoreductase [Pseudomonadales bacterium]|jgi:anaerobic selenocysteine-containing dehydrogenase|nr:formate dehydrogenase [Gammaproteobacteria bacterium]HJP50683.1 molybdopterin-dependent oxidoreductase [Pseudomonadales bacterium]|tara:strand:- start:655 stop:2754 length:2100 start_codon:yes stop_codon:yes gene_type:complete
MMTLKKTFCRVCEPSCGLIAEVENESIVSLKPDNEHPVTRGFACHKGIATLEIHNDQDRLSFPKQKAGEDFQRISWDEAVEGVAARLAAIKAKYGPEAIASYAGNPLGFNSLAGPALGSFMVKNQIRTNFGSGTQDCANRYAGSEAIFGTSTLHPVPDIENTDFLLLFGTNPRVSHMSFFSIADPVKVLREAKNRGAKIRFVDPRINETVKGIGEIVQVNPDTDVYLMAAMLNHLDQTSQFDESYLNDYGDHVAELRAFVEKYPPDRVADIVGLKREEIEKLADEFAHADSAAVYMSTGVNMGRQGTLGYWLLFMLSLTTGNFDRPGGNYYSQGFYPAAKAGRVSGESPFFDSPFGEIRRIRGSLPANLMADMIEAEENPIKAMLVVSGNPLLSVGNASRLERAFASLEFLLVIDIYHTATAELADYVLPATTMYEREDVNITGLGLQHQPFVQYTDQMVPPRDESKPEWWILGRIEQAQGFDSVLDETEEVNLFGRMDHMLKYSDISVDELRQLPDHVAVLPKSQPGRFFEDWIQTESGRIDCCPDMFAEALDLCEEIYLELAEEQEGQLKMISRRTNYMFNSWFHNLESLKREGQLDNPLYMHPGDARARNLGDGSRVTIRNDYGKIISHIVLDEDLKPGTVAMTHGWGHSRTRMQVAKKHAGVNANELLPSGPGSFEKLSNQAFMTGIVVSVDACA